MKIHTVIVTYNATRNNWIRKCLASLDSSTVQSEIIVIDNASTDQTTEIIKKEFPKIKLVESQVNSGFGKANNIGISEAVKSDTDFVFLLNQDAWVEPDTIEKLRNAADKNPDFGIISPIHLNGIGTALDYNFSNQIAPEFCENLYSDMALGKVENKVYPSDFICAASWLVSKECLKKVGGFSPTFFHYAEDDNYVHRLKYKGLKIGVLPTARICHDRESRAVEKNEEYLLRAFQNKLLLKYSNPLQNHDINRSLKQLNFKIYKNILLGRTRWIKGLRAEYKFLNTNKKTITDNFNTSVSDKEYMFLNE